MEFGFIVQAVLSSILGCLAGGWLGSALTSPASRGRPDREGYVGGFPLLGAVGGILWSAGLELQTETWGVPAVVAGFVLLGLIRDLWRVSWRVLLPYGILLLIVGAGCGIGIGHPSRPVEILQSLLWPLLLIGCLKLAAVVGEMPFLLCLESGLVFLLFFSGQAATPPGAVLLTLALVVFSAFALGAFRLRQRAVLGDSGLMALGYLLAAVSMLGRSRSLVLFGLLLPSIVTIFPVVLIFGLIFASYVGNELYQGDPRARRSAYRWSLERERLVILTGAIFLVLNFAALFRSMREGSLPLYAALTLLGLAMGYSFFRTFARRSQASQLSPAEGRLASPSPRSRVTILGVAIDPVDPAEALARISAAAEPTPRFFHVVTADSLAIMRATRDRVFAGMLERADLVVPDGSGLVWGADFLGMPLPARVPGIGLVEAICREAATRRWRLFFLGAAPGRAEKAAQLLAERYPGFQTAGVLHGQFTAGSEAEDQALKAVIAATPHVVFVAMGVPRQEAVIGRLRVMGLKAVAIGVGGSFDVISGAIPRAPVWMQRFALEWLFRLSREPRRFRRMLAIPEFVFAVLQTKLAERQRAES